jgi:hypothetical protein
MGSIEVRLSILDFPGVSEELYTSHLTEYAAMFHRTCDDEVISYRNLAVGILEPSLFSSQSFGIVDCFRSICLLFAE